MADHKTKPALLCLSPFSGGAAVSPSPFLWCCFLLLLRWCGAGWPSWVVLPSPPSFWVVLLSPILFVDSEKNILCLGTTPNKQEPTRKVILQGDRCNQHHPKGWRRRQHHARGATGTTPTKEEGKATPHKRRGEKAAAPEKGERQCKVVVHPPPFGRWCRLPILAGAAFSSLLLGGAGWFCHLPPPPPEAFQEVNNECSIILSLSTCAFDLPGSQEQSRGEAGEGTTETDLLIRN